MKHESWRDPQAVLPRKAARIATVWLAENDKSLVHAEPVEAPMATCLASSILPTDARVGNECDKVNCWRGVSAILMPEASPALAFRYLRWPDELRKTINAGRISLFERILDHPAQYEVKDRAARIGEIIHAINVPEYNQLIGRPAPGKMNELVIGRRTHVYIALYRYVAKIDTVFMLAIPNQREAGICRGDGTGLAYTMANTDMVFPRKKPLIAPTIVKKSIDWESVGMCLHQIVSNPHRNGGRMFLCLGRGSFTIMVSLDG